MKYCFVSVLGSTNKMIGRPRGVPAVTSVPSKYDTQSLW